MLKLTPKSFFKQWLSAALLGLLLILSPCKTRQSLQAAWNIPQTEVSNKSKTVLASADCDNDRLAESVYSFSSAPAPLPLNALNTAPSQFLLLAKELTAEQLYPFSAPPFAKRAIYLLYQRLTLYG